VIIYIAGPMSGYPEFNYPAFNAAEQELSDRGFTVLTPVSGELAPTVDEAKPWDWYMRRALAQVIEAEAIALLDGWAASRGATLEREVAVALGMDVRPLAEWLDEEGAA